MKSADYVKTTRIAVINELMTKEDRIDSKKVAQFVKDQENNLKSLKKYLKFRAKIPKSIELGRQVKVKDEELKVVGYNTTLRGNKLVWDKVELVNGRGEVVEVLIKEVLKGNKK